MDTKPFDIKKGEFFNQIASYFKPYIGSIFLYVLTVIVQICFYITLPILFGVIFNHAVSGKNINLISMVVLIIFVGLIFQTLADFFSEYLLARITSNIITNIRLDLFTHIQKLSYNFYQTTSSSEIISLFSEYIATIEQAMVTATTETIIRLFLCFFSLLIMFWIAWQIAILILLLFVFSIFIPYKIDQYAKKFSYDHSEKNNKLLGVLQEYFATNLMIKVFNLQNMWIDKIQRKLNDVQLAEFKTNFFNSLTPGSLLFSSMLAQLIVLIIGGEEVIHGNMTIGTVVSALMYGGYFLNSLNVLTISLPLFRRASAAIVRIFNVITIKPQITDNPQAVILSSISKHIVFNNVDFYAENQQKILDDITLKITLGQSIGLVGASGSGKSSLFKLLLRLYDPSRGAIIIDDNYNLRDIAIDSYYNQIAFVTQESLLFNTTIGDNILLGNVTASEQDIYQAARQAGLYNEIVGMPDGFETVVGDLGNRLSGGQRQRVALARALVRNPKILLLDEVTSSVDAITEAEMIRNLTEYSQNCTMVMASHRLNVTIQMDCIYVFDHGRIVESGTHKNLLTIQGKYYDLWRKQNSIVLNIDETIKHIDLAYLRKIPVFEFCDTNLLEKIIYEFKIESYDENEIVFQQHSMGNKFYIIYRGRVEVLRKAKSEAETKVIATLEESDFFGEMALLTYEVRNATIKTKDVSVFLTLNSNQFNALLHTEPSVREKIEREFKLRKQ